MQGTSHPVSGKALAAGVSMSGKTLAAGVCMSGKALAAGVDAVAVGPAASALPLTKKGERLQ